MIYIDNSATTKQYPQVTETMIKYMEEYFGNPSSMYQLGLDSEKAVNAAFDAITEALVAGDKVQLVGFGAFEVKARAERIGRNPRTKEEIKIPASKVPVFKPGKALKDTVSK